MKNFGFAVLGSVGLAALVSLVACSDDANDATTGTPDGGVATPDGSTGGDDDASTTTDAGADADSAAPPRPAPVFLDPSAAAAWITIAPAFPFAVTQVHKADGAIAGSRWGRHGGPIVTLGTYGEDAEPTVVQWTIPAGATADATSASKLITLASNLPTTLFYGADGMVDLPFGPFSLFSYTGSGAVFPGEALLYAPGYDSVPSRAKVNGFYSGVGVVAGTKNLLVYSGLSPLATAVSATNDNGLYAAEVCNGKLAEPSPCPAPVKLFGWSGSSGPVATDAHGNVLVGASISGGATSDAVYGLTKAQAAGGAAVTTTPLAGVNSGGSATFATITPEGGKEGFAVGIGFADDAPIYAVGYVEGATITKGTDTIAAAITRATDVEGLAVFADADGDLWIAATKGDEGVYIELRRKP